MKLVIFGGSGLIGAKLVKILRDRGHDVVAASTRTGIDAVTGKGLAEALSGAQVVVDVMNSPSWAPAEVLRFFEETTRNLAAAEAGAGVRHHVALSVVGTERLQDSGYFRAKMAQEKQIVASRIPYTIVRATQFYEFLGGIADASTDGQTVRLPPALMQPLSGDDVASAMADYAVGPALNRIVEVAGPEAMGIDEAVRRFLTGTGDARRVMTEPKAPYYGTIVEERSLTPDRADRLAPTSLEEWLRQRPTAGQAAPTSGR